MGPIRYERNAVNVMNPPKMRVPAKICRAARYMTPALTVPSTKMVEAPMLDATSLMRKAIACMRLVPSAKTRSSSASA
jgi:hypothetical protein